MAAAADQIDIDEQMAYIKQLKEQREENMRRNSEDMAKLNATLSEYKELACSKKKVLDQKLQDLSGLRGEIHLLQSQTDELEKDKGTWQQQLDSINTHNKTMNAELEAALREVEEKMKTLELEISAYKESLQLSVNKVPGNQLRFNFHQLSVTDPDFSCSVWLSLDSQRQFKVHRTFPEIAGVKELVDELNKTSNSSSFLAHMRTKFQQLLNGSRNGATSTTNGAC